MEVWTVMDPEVMGSGMWRDEWGWRDERGSPHSSEHLPHHLTLGREVSMGVDRSPSVRSYALRKAFHLTRFDLLFWPGNTKPSKPAYVMY